jgi:hypothetical protein
MASLTERVKKDKIYAEHEMHYNAFRVRLLDMRKEDNR